MSRVNLNHIAIIRPAQFISHKGQALHSFNHFGGWSRTNRSIYPSRFLSFPNLIYNTVYFQLTIVKAISLRCNNFRKIPKLGAKGIVHAKKEIRDKLHYQTPLKEEKSTHYSFNIVNQRNMSRDNLLSILDNLP